MQHESMPILEENSVQMQFWGPTGLSCPRAIGFSQMNGYLLNLVSISLKVDIHLSVAFVSMTVKFRNSNTPTGSYAFEFPTNSRTTVTNASFTMLTSGASYETVVVEDTPNTDDFFKSKEGGGLRQVIETYKMMSGRDLSVYSPEIFALPFYNLGANEEIEIKVDYLEQILCGPEGFNFNFPMKFPDSELGENGDKMKDLIDISISLNPGLKVTEFDCSHPMDQLDSSNEDKMMMKMAKERLENKNDHFNVKYQCWEDEIVCKAFLEQGDSNVEGSESVMSLLIMPPNPQTRHVVEPPAKHVVFILDRSGSMGFTGVLDSAKEALVSALDQLRPQDKFAICAFDHKQYWFAGQSQSILTQDYTSDSIAPEEETMDSEALSSKLAKFMVPVSPSTISRATQWVLAIKPGGLTNILDPIKQAVTGLNVDLSKTTTTPFSEGGTVPMIFLVTDGKVDDEREICSFVNSAAHVVRFFTFGIGLECNSYFLRKIAAVGRGSTDISLLSKNVGSQLEQLFKNANNPLFLNINPKISRAALQEVAEWFPSSIPDVFEASPVIASCNLHCNNVNLEPELTIDVSGELITIKEEANESVSTANISDYHTTITVEETTQIPLQKVFIKQRLETLITESWFTPGDAGDEIRQQCVNLAIEHSVPSAYTRMALVNKDDVEIGKNGRKVILNSKAKVFVGAAVVGATAFGAKVAMDGGFGDVGCCADFGGDGECCDCGELADCCGAIFGAL